MFVPMKKIQKNTEIIISMGMDLSIYWYCMALQQSILYSVRVNAILVCKKSLSASKGSYLQLKTEYIPDVTAGGGRPFELCL